MIVGVTMIRVVFIELVTVKLVERKQNLLSLNVSIAEKLKLIEGENYQMDIEKNITLNHKKL